MNTLPNKNMTPIQAAIDLLGCYKIAEACGIKGPSVYKWVKAGRLPRTEWTGETNYAQIIERETGGKVTRAALLKLPADNS
jgi:predicted DNA-binding transcriptional regulator AlpA